MAKYKVVVVGGGFGGIKAALGLAKHRLIDVTLISDHKDFRYYPTLYKTATGKSHKVSSISLDDIFNRLPINLVEDTLVGLDRKNHFVTTKSKKKFSYDALVLALGVKTNYFHIEGLEEFAYGIKTMDDAEKFKNHIHKQLIENKIPDHNYVIVGGGPTGIELAGVLPSYIKHVMYCHGIKDKRVHIDLVEAAPRLLPRAPKSLSNKVSKHLKKLGIQLYLGSAVQAETADSLMVNNRPIRSHSVIWTAGVANHPFFVEQQFQLSTKGKVRVDQYLQAEPGIYVIGDNADTPYSGLAQTAIRDGSFVASNILRIADKKDPKPYRAKEPIYVYAVGPKWAAVQWSRIRFYGKLGSILENLAYLVGFHDFEPWSEASSRYIETYTNEENCVICANK